jgi:hypothetical protein
MSRSPVSEVVAKLIETVEENLTGILCASNVAQFERRKAVYLDLIPLLVELDRDALSRHIGKSDAFDAAWWHLNPCMHGHNVSATGGDMCDCPWEPDDEQFVEWMTGFQNEEVMKAYDDQPR